MQVATAREGVLGHLGVGADLVATLRNVDERRCWCSPSVLTVVSILGASTRSPRPSASSSDQWAAAIGIPAGCMWLGLSILRGALQGVGDYKTRRPQPGRRAGRPAGVRRRLAADGLGVTGAYLGTPLSFIAMGAVLHGARCAVRRRPSSRSPGRRRPGRVRPVAPRQARVGADRRAGGDRGAAEHRHHRRQAPLQRTPNLASSYAATAVAAKVLIWVAIGAGFYLVPEVSAAPRRGRGHPPGAVERARDRRRVRGPVLLIFGFGGHPLLRAAFGSKRLLASRLAADPRGRVHACSRRTYLAVQYMLALKRTWFLIALGVVAIAEPMLLLQASRKPTGFAAVVLAIQAVGALLAFGMALRKRQRAPQGPGARRAHRDPAPTWSRSRPSDAAREPPRARALRTDRAAPPALGSIRLRRSSGSGSASSASSSSSSSGSSGSVRARGSARPPAAARGGPSASSSGSRWKSARSVSSVDGRVQRGGRVVQRVQPHRAGADDPHSPPGRAAGRSRWCRRAAAWSRSSPACRSRSARSARPGWRR